MPEFYELWAFAPGHRTVYASSPSHVDERRPVTLVPGQLLSWQLAGLVPGRALPDIRLFTSAGGPLKLANRPGALFTIPVAADGRLTLPSLAEDDQLFLFTAGRVVPLLLDAGVAVAPQRTLDLRLLRSVVVAVRDAQDRPIMGGRLRLVGSRARPDAEHPSGLVLALDRNGTVRFQCMPMQLQLHAEHAAHGAAQAALAIDSTSGAEVSTTIRLLR